MELFATFDRQGRPRGLVPRQDVHRLGLWHKSAQVFIFDNRGRLLMQRRAAEKDLYAGLWDYSVGEHLLPDESHGDGALRGLEEELGITGVALQELGAQRWVTHRSEHHVDREIQQAFRGEYAGALVLDATEVAETRYVEVAELAAWVEASPQVFTPWFIDDLYEFKWLE